MSQLSTAIVSFCSAIAGAGIAALAMMFSARSAERVQVSAAELTTAQERDASLWREGSHLNSEWRRLYEVMGARVADLEARLAAAEGRLRECEERHKMQ